MTIFHIKLSSSDDLSPIQEWMDNHPTSVLHFLNIDGLDVYITYSE